MTPAEILQAFEKADGLPEAALRAAVEQAGGIAPRVIELLGKSAEGVFLLPGEQNILFYGLHALAAARDTSAFEALTNLIWTNSHDFEETFGEGVSEYVTAWLIGLYDGNAGVLYEILGSLQVDGFTRWSVFQALAYFVFDGRLARAELVEYLARFAGDDDALPPEESVWHGWREAVHLLGAQELKQRVIDTWDVDGASGEREIDRQDWIAHFTPEMSEQKFHDNYVRPIIDPVASLSWVKPSDPASLDPHDPARTTALRQEERDWLAGLLISSQAPPTAMNMEMLDGFFCALLAGPQPVLPSYWLPRIWDRYGDESIEFDSREQATYAIDLLMRHWNTIAARLNANYPHQPHFDSFLRNLARDWSEGFIHGVHPHAEAWRKMSRDELVAQTFAQILALCADRIDPDYNRETDTVSDDERKEIADLIPGALALFLAMRTSRQPVRHAIKAGRNEPCPCGSGRKFKNCCIGDQNEARN